MTSLGPDADAAPSLWRHAPFLRLWTGETFSWFGEQVGLWVLPVIAIQALGAGAFQLGLLNTFGTLAFLVVGLPAGAWVDRWLKRETMLRADLARALILATLPVLWLAGVLSFWYLLVAATLVGVLSVFFDVSYQSYIPILVAKDSIADANGKLETSSQVARIAGPGLGGALVAVFSAPLALFATAATYFVSFLVLSTIRDQEQRRPRHERRPLTREIGEGLRWLFQQRLLMRVVACTAISNLFSNITFTLLPLLILRNLGIPPWLYGVMGSVGAIGGVAGALLTARLSARLGEGTIIPASAFLFGVAGLHIPVAIVARGAAVPVLIGMELFLSASVIIYNIAQVSFRQRICPPELLGRMNASVRFIVWGVNPIGAIIGGVLGQQIGIVPALWVGVAGGLLACVPVVFSPLLGMRHLPREVEPESVPTESVPAA